MHLENTINGESVSEHEQPQLDYALQYEIWHKNTDEHVRGQIKHSEFLYGKFLPPPSDAPVIDVGCGMGFAMLMLKEKGFTRVEGIDVDTSQIAACRSRGLDVEQVTEPVQYLLVRPGQYELIMLIDVLEHIAVSEQFKTIVAIAKALRPGGRVIISVPNANSIIGLRWRYMDYTHTSSFTEYSLRYLLLNAGFCNIETTSSDPAPELREYLNPFRLLLALVRRGRRRRLKLAIVRWVWRQVYSVELPTDVSTIPLGRNLQVVAFKPVANDV